MKILQIATRPQRRGAEVFTDELSTWLEARGQTLFTLYLYHFLSPGALRPSTPATTAMESHNSLFEKIPGLNPRLLWFTMRTISLFNPDVVQVAGGRALKYGAIAKAMTKNPPPLVYRSIGSPRFWQKGLIGQQLTQFATNQADAIVAVSDATLSEFGSEPRTQLRKRIHRGTDLSKLRRPTSIDRALVNTPEDAKVIVYSGSLSAEKQPLRAVETLSRLVQQGLDAYLWMLGDGPQRNDCLSVAREKGVEQRLRLIGTVQEVAPYLRASDVHILTSDTEGLPGCLVESAALGLPCVAANVGGVREIVNSEETGFLVEADNISDYVGRIQTLLHDKELYNKFAVAGKKVAEAFSMDAIAPQYLALYQELLGQRPANF